MRMVRRQFRRHPGGHQRVPRSAWRFSMRRADHPARVETPLHPALLTPELRPPRCRATLLRTTSPLAVGRQIGPGVARLGVGQGLLVPVRVARSGEAEHRPLPGRGPLDELEPV
jgi:hypothetical protein